MLAISAALSLLTNCIHSKALSATALAKSRIGEKTKLRASDGPAWAYTSMLKNCSQWMLHGSTKADLFSQRIDSEKWNQPQQKNAYWSSFQPVDSPTQELTSEQYSSFFEWLRAFWPGVNRNSSLSPSDYICFKHLAVRENRPQMWILKNLWLKGSEKNSLLVSLPYFFNNLNKNIVNCLQVLEFSMTLSWILSL